MYLLNCLQNAPVEPIKVASVIQPAHLALRTPTQTVQDMNANVTRDIIEGHPITKKESAQVVQQLQLAV